MSCLGWMDDSSISRRDEDERLSSKYNQGTFTTGRTRSTKKHETFSQRSQACMNKKQKKLFFSWLVFFYYECHLSYLRGSVKGVFKEFNVQCEPYKHRNKVIVSFYTLYENNARKLSFIFEHRSPFCHPPLARVNSTWQTIITSAPLSPASAWKLVVLPLLPTEKIAERPGTMRSPRTSSTTVPQEANMLSQCCRNTRLTDQSQGQRIVRDESEQRLTILTLKQTPVRMNGTDKLTRNPGHPVRPGRSEVQFLLPLLLCQTFLLQIWLLWSCQKLFLLKNVSCKIALSDWVSESLSTNESVKIKPTTKVIFNPL